MLGMHGLRAANYAVQECDLLIVAGARFDDRATGKLDTFAPEAKVIHMDIDIAEINKLRRVNVGLDGSLKKNLAALDPFDGGAAPNISEWTDLCYGRRTEHEWNYDAPGEFVYAPKLLHDLSRRADDMFKDESGAIFTCDVGQHQMWVAQHCYFDDPKDHITSGGLGTMGFGIPAGLGAKLGAPERTVITVTGDGSIMMNIQELATLNRYNIPLKIVLLDNSELGMVRQWQELLHGERYSQSWSEALPDFVKLAEAFGAKGIICSDPADLDDAIMEMLNYDGPVIFDCLVEKHENCFPMIPSGKAHNEMLLGDAQTQGVIDAKGSVLV